MIGGLKVSKCHITLLHTILSSKKVLYFILGNLAFGFIWFPHYYNYRCYSIGSHESLARSSLFRRHANKRLASLNSTSTASSPVDCLATCLMTQGCLATGVTPVNTEVTCNLTLTSSGQDQLLTEFGADVYLSGNN